MTRPPTGLTLVQAVRAHADSDLQRSVRTRAQRLAVAVREREPVTLAAVTLTAQETDARAAALPRATAAGVLPAVETRLQDEAGAAPQLSCPIWTRSWPRFATSWGSRCGFWYAFGVSAGQAGAPAGAVRRRLPDRLGRRRTEPCGAG